MKTMANVLLAIEASPAMVHAREEVADFAALPDALTVNIGTADLDWFAAMEMAAVVMNETSRPWILDPVGLGATRMRQDGCARLLDLCPTVIRGNASEIMTFAGLDATARRVDSGNSVADAEVAARLLAQRNKGIVAVSGPVDFITDGHVARRVTNGAPIMAQVKTMGCSLNGVIAAFCVQKLPLDATVAALVAYGFAGEIAAQKAKGPGTFFPHFLDALATLTPDALTAGARIETG